jgi:hypothetical protein
MAGHGRPSDRDFLTGRMIEKEEMRARFVAKKAT